MTTTAFIVAAFLLFLFNGIIWNSQNRINQMFKLSFFIGAFWGFFEVLKAFGYVVHK